MLAGVALPLAGRRTAAGGTGAAAFALGRAFAAGVVLATGLVHMLPAAMHALSVRSSLRFKAALSITTKSLSDLPARV